LKFRIIVVSWKVAVSPTRVGEIRFDLKSVQDLLCNNLVNVHLINEFSIECYLRSIDIHRPL